MTVSRLIELLNKVSSDLEVRMPYDGVDISVTGFLFTCEAIYFVGKFEEKFTEDDRPFEYAQYLVDNTE